MRKITIFSVCIRNIKWETNHANQVNINLHHANILRNHDNINQNLIMINVFHDNLFKKDISLKTMIIHNKSNILKEIGMNRIIENLNMSHYHSTCIQVILQTIKLMKLRIYLLHWKNWEIGKLERNSRNTIDMNNKEYLHKIIKIQEENLKTTDQPLKEIHMNQSDSQTIPHYNNNHIKPQIKEDSHQKLIWMIISNISARFMKMKDQ